MTITTTTTTTVPATIAIIVSSPFHPSPPRSSSERTTPATRSHAGWAPGLRAKRQQRAVMGMAVSAPLPLPVPTPAAASASASASASKSVSESLPAVEIRRTGLGGVPPRRVVPPATSPGPNSPLLCFPVPLHVLLSLFLPDPPRKVIALLLFLLLFLLLSLFLPLLLMPKEYCEPQRQQYGGDEQRDEEGELGGPGHGVSLLLLGEWS
ncbi:hypothetical protein JHW43_007897 [Diplocarpon mali]|nr:hypothetical protein JHW43_007897 [Diplocarpon mali]